MLLMSLPIHKLVAYALWGALASLPFASSGQAQEAKSATTQEPAAASSSAEADRNARFAQYMSGVKFIGRFTILDAEGRGERMPEEEYTIRKCEKLPQGDLFRFTARIRYGDTDTEVPMDLPVKWAGGTPVITLEKLWIPGLGTFSSRVVIDGDRYAGTWDHGPKGGHLFGRIERVEASAAAPAGDAEETPDAPQ
jgi:hypothetical protein